MRRPTPMLRAVAILLLLAIFPQGCATMPESSGEAALLCGAGGALAGGAIGAAAAGGRNTLTGALIGAAIGGLVGAATCFAIAEYKSKQTKGYQETQQAVQYQPDMGDVVQITNFSLDPSAAAPGSQVAFNSTYYVMSPNSDAEVTVTETRTLKKFDQASGQYKEMGRPTSSVTMKPGTRSADGKFDVRSGVEPGKYLLAFKVDSAGRTDEKELPFEVTTNQAQLQGAKVAQVTSEPIGAKRAAVSAPPPAAPVRPAPPVAAPAFPPSPAPAAAPAAPLSALGEGQAAPPAMMAPPPPMAPTPPPAMAPPPPGPPPAMASLPPGQGKQRHFVANKVANTGTVREGPGAAFRVVAEIEKDGRFVIVQTVMPQGSRTPWHKIRLDDGREGWVNSALGSEIEE